MKQTITLFVILILALILPELIMAQPPGFPEDPPQVPIDGGLGLLAAAGCAYAAKKLYNRKEE